MPTQTARCSLQWVSVFARAANNKMFIRRTVYSPAFLSDFRGWFPVDILLQFFHPVLRMSVQMTVSGGSLNPQLPRRAERPLFMGCLIHTIAIPIIRRVLCLTSAPRMCQL